jgi:hypothetical protein
LGHITGLSLAGLIVAAYLTNQPKGTKLVVGQQISLSILSALSDPAATPIPATGEKDGRKDRSCSIDPLYMSQTGAVLTVLATNDDGSDTLSLSGDHGTDPSDSCGADTELVVPMSAEAELAALQSAVESEPLR